MHIGFGGKPEGKKCLKKFMSQWEKKNNKPEK